MIQSGGFQALPDRHGACGVSPGQLVSGLGCQVGALRGSDYLALVRWTRLSPGQLLEHPHLLWNQ